MLIEEPIQALEPVQETGISADLIAAILEGLMTNSQRSYTLAITLFDEWLRAQKLHIARLAYLDMMRYRAYLDSHYSNAKTSANHRLVVARQLLEIASIMGIIATNPAQRVPGWSVGNETPYAALTLDQAQELLASVDRSTITGLRDYALLRVLIRTGIRRQEAVNVTVRDFEQRWQHNALVIKHGKGDKRRVVKIAPDVKAALQAYLDELKNQPGYVKKYERNPLDAPLFVSLSQNNMWGEMGADGVYTIVLGYVQKWRELGARISPHALRATFITLALDGGAPLHKTQYAAGHADPRTTERYHTSKANLDDAAGDYFSLEQEK